MRKAQVWGFPESERLVLAEQKSLHCASWQLAAYLISISSTLNCPPTCMHVWDVGPHDQTVKPKDKVGIIIIIIINRRSRITSHTSHGHKTGTRSMQPVRSVPLGGPVVS